MPEDAKGQDGKPEGEPKKEEEPKPDAKPDSKGKPKDDLGALRASMNRQADDLRAQLKEAQAKLAGYEEQDAEVKAKLEAAKLSEDPEKLSERVIELTGENVQLKRQVAQWGDKGLDAMAEAHAARLIIGEDTSVFDQLVAELKGATTEEALNVRAASLRAGLKALADMGIGKKGGTPSNEDEPEIDAGISSAGAKSVIAEIRSTGRSPYDPASQKEWAEKRDRLRARARKGK